MESCFFLTYFLIGDPTNIALFFTYHYYCLASLLAIVIPIADDPTPPCLAISAIDIPTSLHNKILCQVIIVVNIPLYTPEVASRIFTCEYGFF